MALILICEEGRLKKLSHIANENYSHNIPGDQTEGRMQDDSETIEDLSRPEHLLVWALRAIAIGRGDCPLVAQTFTKACGPMGGHALHAYFVLIKFIGMTGRRRLRVHTPGCPCVSTDETAIVGVVAAAQESIRASNETLLKMRLGFLVEGEPQQAYMFAAQAVARIFEASGHVLPLHLDTCGQRPAEGCTPRLRVVH